MSPEVVKLVTRCVIDYLGGRQEEFDRLINKAMRLNGELACGNCNGSYIPCRFGTKGNMKSGYICVECGQLISDGRIIQWESRGGKE